MAAGHDKIAQIMARLALGVGLMVSLPLRAMRRLSENRQVDRAVQEVQAMLQAALDQSPAGIVIANAGDGSLRYLNDIGLAICGEDRHADLYGFCSAHFFSRLQPFDLDNRPLDPDEMPLARAMDLGETGSREFRIRRGDDSDRFILFKYAPIRTVKNEVVAGMAVFVDVTERKLADDKIKHLAFYDPLTDLPNRRLFIDRLKQALATRSRHQRQGAILFLDLDNFKTLNDSLGHDVGDLLLQQVAERLVSCVREGDTVARLGGDEFVVMLDGLSESVSEAVGQAEIVSGKILAKLNQTYRLASYLYHSTASIGIAPFAGSQESVEELLKRADLAMYQAKAAGRNTWRFFDPEMQAAVSARAALEGDLREAIENGQFVLHYQAQVDASGRTVGAEALLRWQHPERGLVGADEFILLAEETGLIVPIGRWVLETVAIRLAAWSARPALAHLTLAVNVSARQFHHRAFVDDVLSALERSRANPCRLKLELTEALLVGEMDGVIAKMSALNAKGVGFSLDDFGTGYSSLAYLKRLPIDQLKIDLSFVRDILADPDDAAIARTIVALGQSLGLAVIAEGVENGAQNDFLASHGCLAFQGYFFSQPLPLEGFEEFAGRL
jgi:diguanylate cyclase (GGDEF)-like protein